MKKNKDYKMYFCVCPVCEWVYTCGYYKGSDYGNLYCDGEKPANYPHKPAKMKIKGLDRKAYYYLFTNFAAPPMPHPEKEK